MAPKKPLLGDSDPDANVAKALIDQSAIDNANRIYAQQQAGSPVTAKTPQLGEGGLNLPMDALKKGPPKKYVIRYCFPDPAQFPNPGYFGALTANNPIHPVNENMKRAVLEAFKNLQAQFPDRFEFEEVKDPSKADVSFGAVPEINGYAGDTRANKAVLFSESSFRGSYRDSMAQTAMHEILHAPFGLEHPHETDIAQSGSDFQRPAPTPASYYDTVMTYPKPNGDSSEPMDYTTPYGAMPADVAAILALFPIQADFDKDGPELDTVANAKADNAVRVLSGDGTNQAVKFATAEESTIFQPIQDTGNDTLKNDGKDTVWVRRTANGTIVYANGKETLLPVTFEHFEGNIKEGDPKRALIAQATPKGSGISV